MTGSLHITLLLAALLSGFEGTCGTYTVSHFSVKFKDSERGNRRIPADIFYPVRTKVSVTDSSSFRNEKFPVICFGHGYLISGKWYKYLIEMLVPEGFILIVPSSESGMFPSHMTLARDLCFAAREIYRLNNDSASPIFNHVDTTSCLMGHSMGGGSAIVAASLHPEIDAVVGLAPFDTRPSAIDAASAVTAPALIFAGSDDCITPPVKNQIPIYNSLYSQNKTYILIKGGTHCQMGVSHPNCRAGEKISGCGDSGISNDLQLEILKKYLIPWLNFYLKGDTGAAKLLDSLLKADDAIEFKKDDQLLSEPG